MLRAIVNLLKGQVSARVESGFPERVLNLCGAHGIRFWDVRWESELAFSFTLSRRDWKRLRRLTAKMDCTLRPVSWRGTPFFLGRLRRRAGLWVTLPVCLGLLVWGSFYIWDFQIEGNETVTDREILRALEAEGITYGTFALGFSSPEVRNDVLLALPELSYIAVNVRGCRAYVQVRERVHGPEVVDRRQLGNTVAAKDGLVTAVRPYDGEKLVLPGTTVRQGQLLISGVVERGYGGVRYLSGRGEVWARTWYVLHCRVPLTAQEKTYTGAEKTRYALLIGKNRINLYFNSSQPGYTCDKMISWNQCVLPGDVPLPVTVVKETLRAYTTRQTGREDAQALGRQALMDRLAQYVEEGEILSVSVRSREEQDTLLVTLTAECEEQIGKFVDIPEE